MRDQHSDSPGWVIPPDFVTGEVGDKLRADPILAAQLFDPGNPMVQAALDELRRELAVDDDALAEVMRYAYETNQREWLKRQAAFDPDQFLRVSDRLGVLDPRRRRGRRPMTEDASAEFRRDVVVAVRRVLAERPSMSLAEALLRTGHGDLDPRTVRDWLERFPEA
ncbi:MAG TPA: hypothetical protein VGJ60_11200 [Chloroflexota bacterium]|jgi:hypothetical protein